MFRVLYRKQYSLVSHQGWYDQYILVSRSFVLLMLGNKTKKEVAYFKNLFFFFFQAEKNEYVIISVTEVCEYFTNLFNTAEANFLSPW